MGILEDNKKIENIEIYISKKYGDKKIDLNALQILSDVNSYMENSENIIDFKLLIELINKNEIISTAIKVVLQEKLYLKNYNIEYLVESYCVSNNISDDDFRKFQERNFDFQVENNLELNYIKEIRRIPLLTPEESKELLIRIKNGDEQARNLFINRNLRLVVKCAQQYQGKGIDFLDLIQEGNVGLIKAINKFDVTLGFQFSTYALYWIRQSIMRALSETARIIRIPVHATEKIDKYKRIESELELKLKRKPTINEIAEVMNETPQNILLFQKNCVELLSLNTPISEDSEEIGEFVCYDEDESFEEAFEDKEKLLKLKKLIDNAKLTERELDVLKLRFGFGDNKPKTLEEIGKKYNLTRERIRQIEIDLLCKLRKAKGVEELSEYMEYPEKSLKYSNNHRRKTYRKSYYKN